MQAPLRQVLSASGSTEWFRVNSGLCQVRLDATAGNGFGSGNVKLEIKSAAGNALPMVKDNAVMTYTISQAVNIEIPQGTEIRATLASATSPTLDVQILEIANAPFRA